MGLGNAVYRVYRLQALNLLRLARWLFWAGVFFGLGYVAAVWKYDPKVLDPYIGWRYYVIGGVALIAFLLRLWEWRLSKPVSANK